MLIKVENGGSRSRETSGFAFSGNLSRNADEFHCPQVKPGHSTRPNVSVTDDKTISHGKLANREGHP
jgi:hypothetical protein